MVRITPFDVEQWMDEYETVPGCINVAETCAASLSLDDLAQLAPKDDGGRTAAIPPVDTSTKLTYGAIKGSDKLRENVAALYQHEGVSAPGEGDGQSKETVPSPSADSVLITQGAIGANFLLMYTLIQPADHVICVYPTYQQLYSVPESLGADVSLWKLKEENGFVPDVSELQGLVKPNTKMIIINNPNNPTGAAIPTSILSSIVAFARSRNIIIFSDEVYRPLYHDLFDEASSSTGRPIPTAASSPIPPPITAFNYPNVLSTGSMSKAYALAGIRLGWIVSPSPGLVSAIATARDYTTISVSGLDDSVAAFALSPRVVGPLLRRNVALANTNFALLEAFVEKYKAVCSWVKPVAGTTAFVRFSKETGPGGQREPVDDVEFCLDLLRETKVFFVPGSRCFGGGEDFKGYVRVGYVCHTDVLREGLEKLGDYIEKKLL